MLPSYLFILRFRLKLIQFVNMRLLSFIILLSFVVISAKAQYPLLPPPAQENKGDVKWYTIQEAERLNKIHPKKIMIDVYTDWCGWCKKMDKATFSHPVISKILNEYYYAVKFDAESTDSVIFNGQKYINENNNGNGGRSTHQLAITLLKGQLSYPSIVYFTEKLEFLGPVPGYKTPEQQELILTYIALDKFKTVTYEEFAKTFVGQIKPAAPQE